MLELLSSLISTIGQIKLRYNSYNLQTFINDLVIHEYDIEKIERMIGPIKNAYKID